ncbi:hypothetical protein A2U01_0078865 [Trifolium medium]|uniref:Uncharacterized protein n=1 Tax=Trifolium medium TaxID=97028 RepID=A0A392TAP1_9FABA|nr:hypothetical protein [Trifolium medium]
MLGAENLVLVELEYLVQQKVGYFVVQMNDVLVHVVVVVLAEFELFGLVEVVLVEFVHE